MPYPIYDPPAHHTDHVKTRSPREREQERKLLEKKGEICRMSAGHPRAVKLRESLITKRRMRVRGCDYVDGLTAVLHDVSET